MKADFADENAYLRLSALICENLRETTRYLIYDHFYQLSMKHPVSIAAYIAVFLTALFALIYGVSAESTTIFGHISMLLASAALFRILPTATKPLVAIGLGIATAIGVAIQHFALANIPIEVQNAFHWIICGMLFAYAIHKQTLTTWIFVSMIIGVALGNDHPDFALNLQVLSKIFIKLIKTIVAPLLISTLIVGIAGHANIKQVGRMGWKALLYFEIVTTLALFIGLGAINFSQAGAGIKQPVEELSASQKKAVEVMKENAEKQKDHTTMILDIFPENLAKSIAEGKVLQIVIFSVLFAIGMAMLPTEKRTPVLQFMESLSEIMFKFTNLIMYYAPIGVGAAIAVTVAHMGIEVLLNLGKLLLTLYAALSIFLLLILLPIALYIKLPILKFIKAISEPVSIAFATTSSDSALPKAMEKLAEFGIPRRIISFVLPTGYTFNLDGTTLYLSLATIFVAQAANIPLSFEQQLVMMLSLMLTSKGVAAVPRASLVILFATASSYGLPEWPIYLILGIDELMDMARTAVNIIGNCLATVVVAKWEGEWSAEATQP